MLFNFTFLDILSIDDEEVKTSILLSLISATTSIDKQEDSAQLSYLYLNIANLNSIKKIEKEIISGFLLNNEVSYLKKLTLYYAITWDNNLIHEAFREKINSLNKFMVVISIMMMLNIFIDKILNIKLFSLEVDILLNITYLNVLLIYYFREKICRKLMNSKFFKRFFLPYQNGTKIIN